MNTIFKMVSTVKRILRKFGIDIVKYPQRDLKRRIKLILHYGINLIFDIGANEGLYAKKMREVGYKGRLVSFEPLTSAYNRLLENARGDLFWETANFALGNDDFKTVINISEDYNNSSILSISPAHIKTAPKARYIGKEEILVKKIDSIIGDYYRSSDRLFVKIDTQGYELYVIEGAKNSFNNIIGIQLEMSLSSLYEGELLFPEMLKLLSQKGYLLKSLEPGYSDRSTGQLLQVDGIFFR